MRSAVAAGCFGFVFAWLVTFGSSPPLTAQQVTRRLPPVTEGADATPAAATAAVSPTDADDPPASENAAADAEPEEIVPLPEDWYDPYFWVSPRIWERSFQLGISGSSGNSETLSFQFGTDWKRKIDWSQLDISLVYNKSQNDGIETKNNGLLNVDHFWRFEESPWSLFLKSAVEYDEFKAFDLRVAINGGASYRFIDSETLQLDGRLGSGASTEFGGPDNRWVPEAVVGSDYSHQWTEQQKFKLSFDYFPDISDPSQFRVVSKASWELMLDKPKNLSFKINLIDRYDSTPHGRLANDIDYAFVLMWKR